MSARRPGYWRGWRSRLLAPLGDAAFGRFPNSSGLIAHACDFPDARAEAEASAAAARGLGFAVDAGWIERRLVSAALDRQDNFARLVGRSLIRPDRLEVRGSWPRGVFVALGLHWGTGFPVLEHLARQDRQPAFVYLPEPDSELVSLPARLYDRLHLRALAGFGNSIRVGGAYQRIVEALAAGRVPVVLFDAPATPGSSQIEQVRSGYRVSLRTGVLGLLAEKRVPYVFFRCAHRQAERRRVLEISPPGQSNAAAQIAGQAADFLLDALRGDSAQWHLWPAAGQLLDPAPAAGPDDGDHSPLNREASS